MNNLFLDPQSNEADFARTFTVRDATTGEASDLSGITEIGLSLRFDGHEALRVTLASGEITIDADPATGRFAVVIPAARFRTIRGGAYSIGIVMSDGADRIQAVLGTLPIVEGHPHELA